MADIPASLVKELREETNVGMMECKRALVETDGDKDKAIQILRERGVAIAGKKASRAANEGLIAASVSEDGTKGVLIEINCETDFVARNENFQAFVADLARKALTVESGQLADAVADIMPAKITEIGENLVIGRNVKYELQGSGLILSYIHLGGKVGVLLEIGTGKPETAQQEALKELAKDVTLQIAASSPEYLSREEVPAETVDTEKAIFAKQMEGKPENIIDKIVTGKLDKFYSQICLLEQEFVKDSDTTITTLLEEKSKELNDTVTINRYERFKIGG